MYVLYGFDNINVSAFRSMSPQMNGKVLAWEQLYSQLTYNFSYNTEKLYVNCEYTYKYRIMFIK